jgi:hypothetical protein
VSRPRRRFRASWIITFLLVVLVFLLGIALGEALHDNPRPGGTQTVVETVQP